MGSLKSNLLLGLAGGIAGTAAMSAYFTTLHKLKPDAMAAGAGEEPSPQRLARRVLKSAGVKKPSSDTRAMGGQVIHWGYGTSWGAAVGAARAAGIPLDWGGGLLLGVGLWAFGDLWMVHKMGLARHPREYPMQMHASTLGAHLAYGLGVWAAVEGLGKLQHSENKAWKKSRRWRDVA
jgi:hypothetical protein